MYIVMYIHTGCGRVALTASWFCRPKCTLTYGIMVIERMHLLYSDMRGKSGWARETLRAQVKDLANYRSV